MPPDVVAALKDAEFEDFLPRLEAELKSERPYFMLFPDLLCLEKQLLFASRRLTFCVRVQRHSVRQAQHLPAQSEGGEEGGRTSS